VLLQLKWLDWFACKVLLIAEGYCPVYCSVKFSD